MLNFLPLSSMHSSWIPAETDTGQKPISTEKINTEYVAWCSMYIYIYTHVMYVYIHIPCIVCTCQFWSVWHPCLEPWSKASTAEIVQLPPRRSWSFKQRLALCIGRLNGALAGFVLFTCCMGKNVRKHSESGRNSYSREGSNYFWRFPALIWTHGPITEQCVGLCRYIHLTCYFMTLEIRSTGRCVERRSIAAFGHRSKTN